MYCLGVRDPPADEDSLEVELLTQLLAGIVQSSTQSHPLIVEVNEKVDPVKVFPGGIVKAESAVRHHIPVGVFFAQPPQIHDESQGNSHNPSFVFHAYLTLGEQCVEGFELVLRPCAPHAVVKRVHHLLYIGIVGRLEIPNLKHVLSGISHVFSFPKS
jgi:hypothetical protein